MKHKLSNFSLGKYQSAHKAALRSRKKPGNSYINCSFYQSKIISPETFYQTTCKVAKEQQVPGENYKDRMVCVKNEYDFSVTRGLSV